MNFFARHSGMECRNPGAMDGNAFNANAPACLGILAVWMPLSRCRGFDPAGMTTLGELE
ncbi:MAG: hypothetical protein JSR27_11145 [Proteobacteria bacterium]|nr:hypothetical protein [Pseudomonadota bacterium]